MSSETITKNDLKAILDDVLPNVATDFIVEQGTSSKTGITWEYRKWNSGTYECWGVYSASIAVNTSSAGYGGYRSDGISVSFPITFNGMPTVTAVIGSGSQGVWVNNSQPSTTAEVFYLSSAQSQSSASRQIHIHAIGKWEQKGEDNELRN